MKSFAFQEILEKASSWWRSLFQSYYDFRAEVSAGYYSSWMLFAIGLFVVIIGLCVCALIFQYLIQPRLEGWSEKLQKTKTAKPTKAKKPKEKEEKKKTLRKMTEEEIKNPSMFTRDLKMAKHANVTDKTRDQIANVLGSVNTFYVEQKTRVAETPEQAAEFEKSLDESELILGLAQTLISEPVIDQTSEGKFSKMTIDGELLFDEELRAKH